MRKQEKALTFSTLNSKTPPLSGELIVLGGHDCVGKSTLLRSLMVGDCQLLPRKTVLFSNDAIPFNDVDMLHCFDIGNLQVSDMVLLCRDQVKHDLGSVVIDGFAEFYVADTKEAWQRVARELSVMAQTLGVPVVVSAPLSLAHQGYPKLGDKLAINFLVRQQSLIHCADKVMILHRYGLRGNHDALAADAPRKSWTWLVLGKGFTVDDGHDLLFHFDGKLLQECEKQSLLLESIELQQAQIAQKLADDESAKKQAEASREQESIPDRILELEDRLDAVYDEIDSLREELESLQILTNPRMIE